MKRKVTPRPITQITMIRQAPFRGAGIARAADGGRVNADHVGHGVDGQKRSFHALDPSPRHSVNAPHPPPKIRKIIAATRQQPAPETAHRRAHHRGANAKVPCNCGRTFRMAGDIYGGIIFHAPILLIGDSLAKWRYVRKCTAMWITSGNYGEFTVGNTLEQRRSVDITPPPSRDRQSDQGRRIKMRIIHFRKYLM